jgi:hypothetical protein
MEALMLGKNRILPALAALLVLAFVPGCNSKIDKTNSPNVVLEVENVTIPPITASLDQTTMTCRFTLTNATATFKNKPKNADGVTSPFNDIILKDVIVTYAWDDGAGVTGPVSFGVGGAVPANGSSPAQFGVVTVGDLSDRFGHTASLGLTFEGETVDGKALSVTTGGTLAVGSCN